MEIRKIDFVAVPSQDGERARQFYADVLGLRADSNAKYEFWAGETVPRDLGAHPFRHGVRAAEERPHRAARR
jgi:catechol 2,3-dioxygenase-like lactoylglutathione lyase family enzyme